MSYLKRLLRKLFPPKEEEIKPVTFDDCWMQLEIAFSHVVNAGYGLEDTQDWNTLPDQLRKSRLTAIQKYYQETSFKLESLKDEVLIAKQEVTSALNTKRIEENLAAKELEAKENNPKEGEKDVKESTNKDLH